MAMRSTSALPILISLLAACSSPATVSAPDATAPDATAPDATTPDATTPDATAPDAITPDAITPDATTPDATAPDATALSEPPWVMLDVRTTSACPPLMPCGGPVLGTWDVAGGCFELPIPNELMRCPGAGVTRTEGRARGRVTFGPAVASRAAQWEVEAEIVIPSVCATLAGGCPSIQGTLRNAFPETACTSSGPGNDCRCTVRQTGSIRDGGGYTTMNNQIVSTTTGRRWHYCVTGDRLRYRDASTSEPREPGLIELQRRTP